MHAAAPGWTSFPQFRQYTAPPHRFLSFARTGRRLSPDLPDRQSLTAVRCPAYRISRRDVERRRHLRSEFTKRVTRFFTFSPSVAILRAVTRVRLRRADSASGGRSRRRVPGRCPGRAVAGAVTEG